MDLARTADTPSSEVVFQYSGSGKNIAVLQPLVGLEPGWLACARMTITASRQKTPWSSQQSAITGELADVVISAAVDPTFLER